MSQLVFICYARVDVGFALPLAEQLKARGVGVWIDKWNARPGDDWDRDIERALNDCTHLLIVLSPDSVDSNEVRGEFHRVLSLRKPIIPLLYKPCVVPRQLAVVQYVDFTKRAAHDGSALREVLEALSPVVDASGERPRNFMAPAAVPVPVPEPARAPSPLPSRASAVRGSGLMTRTKTAIKAAVLLLLVAGAWYGLDEYTWDRRTFRDATLSPDGALMATTSFGAQRATRIWDVTSGKVAALLPVSNWASMNAWSPDGKKLAIGAGDGMITVYDAGTWMKSLELKGPQNFIDVIAWSPDGSAIATGDAQGSLWVWNIAGGALRFTKPVHRDRVQAVLWSPDGTRLASGSSDDTVAIVNASSGAVEKQLKGHVSTVTALAYSPDGRILVSASLEAPFLIAWDEHGDRHDLQGHRREVGRVRWSADGRYLASIDKDNLVYVWDPRRFEMIRRFSLAGEYPSGTSLAWSPNSTRLAAGDAKGIQLLDPQSDVPVSTLPDPSEKMFHNLELAGWSADGTRLAAYVSFEGTASVWDVARASRLQSFSIGAWRALTD